MLHSSTIKFLKDLKKNNTKEWFDTNRKIYEIAKQDFLELTNNVLISCGKFEEAAKNIDPKKCIFRINRDIRFSKDKSPYKTNFGLNFSPLGKGNSAAGYYFHCEPGSNFIGGGIYMPMPLDVKKIRQEIDYNFNDFKKTITNKKFVNTYKNLSFNKEFTLQRAPKEYSEDNVAIEYLKLKSWTAGAKISDADLQNKNLSKIITSHFETLKPLIDFLNNAVVQ